MELDALFLSRLQFAWVIIWHVMLPAFTIGTASYVAVLETSYFITKREIYLRLSTFWIRIFSVSFGMGVVSGIVMPFQFGTNWSRLSDAAANVIAPLLAYEALTAFFLEAAFLGVLLFGRNLVPRWAYLGATLMVALGTLISTFWILSANSWLQTPAGYEVVDGRFFATSWLQAIFNPSFPYRLAHNVIGFYITTGFVVMGVSAYLLRRGTFAEEGRVMMKMTLWLLTVLVPLQMYAGDAQGINTLQHQPAKLAALEAIWETGTEMPLTLFAIPDEKTATNLFAIDIPYLGSLIWTHTLDGEVQGLDAFPRENWPPVVIPFFAFRAMVGLAVVMLGLVVWGNWLRYRGRLTTDTLYLKVLQITTPIGFFAVISGWLISEVGRQPWTIYNMLRTADSVSPSLTGLDVLISLIGYVAVYLFVYPTGILLMYRIVRKGPRLASTDDDDSPVKGGRPDAPVIAGAVEQ
ncbi:cytochrome d ubiquinol oxidase subunit I [Kaistia soli DSM 19436]|uniref:Cytochrome d ubiquinol oxidase subunit I n=1 Tax=Kaistia soli DSM 19436 TaxID=1122133 RepID=A0A1M5IZR8_9HYPH|nr:cytochrome ubiquinol oxidase subunit I [Kaistia soli]SHG33802.1 cytochrome d ubiquinol oxidase subunit I [Kaistia soli DSM 19436]